MASVNERISARAAAESAEIVQLRRELQEARTRLEEETAYFRAELEAARRRAERQTVREHADEVARRRRVEQQLEAVRAELKEARAQAKAAEERYAALSQQLRKVQEETELRIQQEVEKVKAAARYAWQGAEEEVARIEQEHAATRRLLAQSQARESELEDVIRRLRAKQNAQPGIDPDTQKLISSLKKALWATAQARRRAEVQLALLQASGVRPPETEKRFASGAAAVDSDASPAAPQYYNELDTETLKSLKLSDLHDDLAEDFLLVPGDTSLDPDTFEKLDAMPEPEETPVAAPMKPFTQRVRAVRGKAEPTPLYELEPRSSRLPEWVDRSRHSMWRVVLYLLIGAGLSFAAYWLLVNVAPGA